MIPKEELVPGSWYDGFVFKKARARGLAQDGVATAIWLQDDATHVMRFWVPTYSAWMNHYESTLLHGCEYRFEPSIKSAPPNNVVESAVRKAIEIEMAAEQSDSKALVVASKQSTTPKVPKDERGFHKVR